MDVKQAGWIEKYLIVQRERLLNGWRDCRKASSEGWIVLEDIEQDVRNDWIDEQIIDRLEKKLEGLGVEKEGGGW